MQISGRNFWLVILLLIVLLRLPTLYVEVLDPDEAGHAVHSMVWLDGGVPYVDFIDNKQPMLYATYAGILALFGRSLIPIHLVTIGWLWLTAFLLARLARAVTRDERVGAVAALCFTLASSAYIEKDMLASNTEIFENLPLVAAFLLLLHPRRNVTSAAPALEPEPVRGWAVLGAGVLCGIATLYNLKAGVALPVLALFLLVRNRYQGILQNIILFSAVTVPWIPFIFYFSHHDALDKLIYWNFTLNFKYTDAGVPWWIIDYKRGTLYGFPRLLLFMAATFVLWSAVGREIAGWLGGRDRLRWSQLLRFVRREPFWIAAWLAACFPAVMLGGRFYGHYFIQLLPPLCVLAAGPLARLWSAGPGRRLLRIGAAVGLVLPVLFLTVAGQVRIARGGLESRLPQLEPVARYIREHTCPADRIFVWGNWSPLYYAARRPPATRFVYPQTLAGYVPGHPASLDPAADTSHYLDPEHWQLFAADMAAHPAVLIVDTAPGKILFWEKYPVGKYPILQELLDQHYHLETTIAGVVLYRRNGHEANPKCPN